MKAILKISEWAEKLTHIFKYALILVALIEAIQFFTKRAKDYLGNEGWDNFKNQMGVNENEQNDLASDSAPHNSDSNEDNIEGRGSEIQQHAVAAGDKEQ